MSPCMVEVLIILSTLIWVSNSFLICTTLFTIFYVISIQIMAGLSQFLRYISSKASILSAFLMLTAVSKFVSCQPHVFL